MRYSVGWAVAALVAAACGFETDTTSGHVVQRGDAVCAKCIVTGEGETDFGNRWQVSAIPSSWPDAAPGFEGQGIAATGFLRIERADGSNLDWAIDTILHCTRDPGRDGALVSGTSPAGFRFFVNASEGSNTLAVSPDRWTVPPGNTWVAFVLNARSPGTGALHVDKLDRCEPCRCAAGECIWPATGRCGPCDSAPPVGTGPPPVVSRPPPSDEPLPPFVPL
jgi:hypothetical protein